jgi:hypothetical protein
VNQRASVEILNATDTKRFGRLDGFSPYHIRRRTVRRPAPRRYSAWGARN